MVHLDILTHIATYVWDESFILICTGLNTGSLYSNRLVRMEVMIYLHALREYQFTIWKEESQRREIDAGLDRIFGSAWDW